ncbi:hypothetical protein H0H92_005886, partial [Tricholoma furcatifolium]
MVQPQKEHNRIRRPRKRARKERYDVSTRTLPETYDESNTSQPDDARRFLDMEAEVSHNEEGDNTSDSSLGKIHDVLFTPSTQFLPTFLEDFINDESSESEGETHVHNVPPSALPHLDNLEDESYASEDEWGSEEGIVGWDDDPAIASHDEVLQLMTTEEANMSWQSYLAEERRLRELEAQEKERNPYDRHWYPDPVPDTVPEKLIPDSIVPLLPRPSTEKHLWRVA